jgi:Domain of unknown function (DUF4283)
VCNKLGHKSFQCRSRAQAAHPSVSNARSPPDPSLLAQKRSDPPTPMGHFPPVTRFGYSKASQRLEASVENSVVLTDVEGIGRNRIEAALNHIMPQHHWIARYYDDSRFLIEAPNPRWLQTVLMKGTLRLENTEFPVSCWDPALDEGAKLRPVWVRVRGFPMKLWFFHEFARLFEPYGQVLALDQDIAEHVDFRVAHVRVGLCDAMHLPPLQWILYCDPNGFWTRYDVTMEVESGSFGVFHPLHLPHLRPVLEIPLISPMVQANGLIWVLVLQVLGLPCHLLKNTIAVVALMTRIKPSLIVC